MKAYLWDADGHEVVLEIFDPGEDDPECKERCIHLSQDAVYMLYGLERNDLGHYWIQLDLGGKEDV